MILEISFLQQGPKSKIHNLKNCIQKVYDSPSILKKCMIVCRKVISHEYNSENLDKPVDLPKFHKYEQISMTQRS